MSQFYRTLTLAAASLALAYTAVAAPASADHHLPGEATPTAAPTEKACDCADCKDAGPGGGHHGKHAKAASGALAGGKAAKTAAGLSDMAHDAFFDCDEGDAVCLEAQKGAEKAPEWMRRIAGKAFGRVQIEPHTLIQSQFAALAGDKASFDHGDRAERLGFALRRARFGANGHFGHAAEFGAYLDLAATAGTPLVSEAWVALTTGAHSTLTVGAYRTPFSRGSMVTSARMAMAERPHAIIAMAPFRQLGATWSGHYPDVAGLSWYAGVYNGFERHTNLYRGFNEFGSLGGNRDAGLAFVGRLSAEPLGAIGPEVYDATAGGLRVAVGGGHYLSNGPTTTLSGYGADLHVKIKGAHLMAEWLADSADPKEKPTAPATLNASRAHSALVAEAGYTTWRVTVAGRFQQIDPDTSRKDSQDEQILSGCLSYQVPKDRVRLQLEYDHRRETSGPELDNDVLFAQLQLFL